MKLAKGKEEKFNQISISDEDKIRWEKLLKMCANQPSIIDETFPPLYEASKAHVAFAEN